MFQHIELFLDASYAPLEQQRFIFSSRCICNYLERALAVLRFPSPYSRLNIHCSRESQAVRVRPLDTERLLEVCIEFNVLPLGSLHPESLQHQFARIISAGLEAASALTPMPVDECARTLQEFADGGFVNRWLHQDKHWQRWNCRCVISAELTTAKFTLDQQVFLDAQLAATRRIAETRPREELFVEYLGGLTINSQGILQYKKSKVLTAFDLHKKDFVDRR